MESSTPELDQAAQGKTVLQLGKAREQTMSLIESLPQEQLETSYNEIMSPIVWDLAHIAAYEDLWLVRHSTSHSLLRPELAETYDALETPRDKRREIELLNVEQCLTYIDKVRERTLEAVESESTDNYLVEMVIRHELQHLETMLQAIQLADIEYEPIFRRDPDLSQKKYDGTETVTVEAGEFEIGAGSAVFSYDNERPSHTIQFESFEIGIVPVTNSAYDRFVDSGGYQDRRYWSDAGWLWLQETGIQRPGYWTADGQELRFGDKTDIDLKKPVMNISWFEANAFAKFCEARLPTEYEWEIASALASNGSKHQYPWGDRAPDGLLANLDRSCLGPSQVAAYKNGLSSCGCYGTVGDVWEWTESDFTAYSGFKAYPYREYSEIYFGDHYKVLRGGSWATSSLVASSTNRNWDLPQRRQVFAGVRLAR